MTTQIIKNLMVTSKKAMFFTELGRIADTEEFTPLDEL